MLKDELQTLASEACQKKYEKIDKILIPFLLKAAKDGNNEVDIFYRWIHHIPRRVIQSWCKYHDLYFEDYYHFFTISWEEK